jgi:hypothetical protein
MNKGAALLTSQAHGISVPDIELADATTLRTGDTARTLRTLSRETDMTVLGTDRRPDRHGERFGSISFHTAAISKCAATVVPPTSLKQKAGLSSAPTVPSTRPLRWNEQPWKRSAYARI